MPRRECEICERTFNRRNMTELWVKQNPGARTGWLKRKVRICLHCQNAAQTVRILNVVRLTVLTKKQQRHQQAS